ncbi:hypothetical protein CDL12_29127 [Handroanthus impetiginosus]|uniref:Uncharacterized protein n=1 Tax=Handroanthus impetiginosus TaxID=429701 RepID=A0A2G9FZA2_9LAMI|nr:hypothetical protein CDL12_29127 [Handroanthus impetiginosus]
MLSCSNQSGNYFIYKNNKNKLRQTPQQINGLSNNSKAANLIEPSKSSIIKRN